MSGEEKVNLRTATQKGIEAALENRYVAGKKRAPDGVIAARIARRVRRAARTKTRKRTAWQKIVSIYATAIRAEMAKALGGGDLNTAQKVMINKAAMKAAIKQAKITYQPVKNLKPTIVRAGGPSIAVLIDEEKKRITADV